jgi:hypothetical protein
MPNKNELKVKYVKSFCKVKDAATGAVHCVKCQFVLGYSVTKTGISHLSHHSCTFSAGNSNTEKYLHP